jgi:signal transduction histidine kinase
LCPGGDVDAEDLLFGYGRVSSGVGEEAETPPPEAVRAPAASAAVDLIINELAHEFKNPMVTIKTVAQHLERLLEDETGREQVARLTGEAVDRMDRALENLLQFTRFRTPSPHDVTFNVLLASSLTEVTAALTERRVLLNYAPPDPLMVFVDPEQVGYAFENLLRAIARDMQEGQTLSIRPVGTRPTIRLDFPAGGHPIAERLAAFLDHGQNGGDTQLPLGLVFAKTLIERNGGRIEISHVNDGASITVSLPRRDETAREDGQATSPHS